MKLKYFYLPTFFAAVIFSSCSSSDKITAASNTCDEPIKSSIISSFDKAAAKEYQPSGLVNNTETDLDFQKYSVETNLSNFDAESPSTQISDNFTADKNTVRYADTVMIKSLAMIELNEANQSFTLGLTSFIALLAAAILALPGIFIFSITFLIASLALGILGLRKGIIAKRIIAEQKEIYSNAGKATWGIILSMGIFATIVAAIALYIYLIISYAGF